MSLRTDCSCSMFVLILCEECKRMQTSSLFTFTCMSCKKVFWVFLVVAVTACVYFDFLLVLCLFYCETLCGWFIIITIYHVNNYLCNKSCFFFVQVLNEILACRLCFIFAYILQSFFLYSSIISFNSKGKNKFQKFSLCKKFQENINMKLWDQCKTYLPLDKSGVWIVWSFIPQGLRT